MPSELNRRALLAAAAAFLLALAVAYALGSSGQASEASGSPGSPAAPLDVAADASGQSTLGDAQALPALVARPKPPPPPEPEPEPEPEAPVTTEETPPYVAPQEPDYDPPVEPVVPEPTPPPPVEFDDSG